MSVNRRPKRAHPHCPLNTLADKLFLALRWAPFGRRSALNRSPPILVKWQAFQVLRHRRWVGPRYTTLLRAIELWGAVQADGPGRLAGDEESPATNGRLVSVEQDFSQQIKA